jgi:hypothetical protein
VYDITLGRQDDITEKFTTYAGRLSVYAEGKLAFADGRLRSANPYAASREFSGLWWHGWDTAKVKSKGKTSPIDERTL